MKIREAEWQSFISARNYFSQENCCIFIQEKATLGTWNQLSFWICICSTDHFDSQTTGALLARKSTLSSVVCVVRGCCFHGSIWGRYLCEPYFLAKVQSFMFLSFLPHTRHLSDLALLSLLTPWSFPWSWSQTVASFVTETTCHFPVFRRT